MCLYMHQEQLPQAEHFNPFCICHSTHGTLAAMLDALLRSITDMQAVCLASNEFCCQPAGALDG